jgi:SAM-dependent methyltransferase
MSSPNRHLDIGCGGLPRNPFGAEDLYGLDLKVREGIDYGDVIMNEADVISNQLPYEDNFFSSVSAYDFIEHLPRLLYIDGQTRFPFVNFMSEIYRILQPGGTFYALTPNYPNDSCFSDPTHVNFITRNTHKYFCEPFCWAVMYGFIGSFKPLRVKRAHFSLEVTPPKNRVKRLVLSVIVNLHPRAKQHLLWELVKVES